MIRCLEDVEAEVAPDERPIEEIIEEKRVRAPSAVEGRSLALFDL